MDKIEYTKYAYKQMKNVFNQGNISVPMNKINKTNTTGGKEYV